MPFQPLDIEPINASQQSLVHIFGDEYAFSIPPYQWPYAWEEMPQNPRPDSPWLNMFSDDEERHEWTHSLGNLVLLTRAKNSQASNWDFERKKSEYFSDRNGISSFRITTQVIKEKAWNKKTLERRHWRLMQKLSDVWDLDIDRWYKKYDLQVVS